MSTPVLQREIRQLRNQVGPYSVDRTFRYSSPLAFSFQEVLASPWIYPAIAGLLFVLLAFWQPSFLYITITTRHGEGRKLSPARFLTFWLFFTILLSAGVAGYNYKQKQET